MSDNFKNLTDILFWCYNRIIRGEAEGDQGYFGKKYFV